MVVVFPWFWSLRLKPYSIPQSIFRIQCWRFGLNICKKASILTFGKCGNYLVLTLFVFVLFTNFACMCKSTMCCSVQNQINQGLIPSHSYLGSKKFKLSIYWRKNCNITNERTIIYSFLHIHLLKLRSFH